MYGIPKDLNLSPVVKEFTTQIRVGQFDLQFNFGDVCFVIESPVTLYRYGKIFARWESGKWPDPGFYEIMNIEVTSCEIANDKLIVIEFKNGITMHLVDDSEQYECMQISIKGDPTLWVI